MAFKSIGQKYGFVSAGDVFRQEIADARTEEQAKAQKLIDEERQKTDTERQKAENAEAEKFSTVKKMVKDGVISIDNAMAYFGYSKEQILAE
jgi:uncharacterized protein YaiL (DUF2058 family)